MCRLEKMKTFSTLQADHLGARYWEYQGTTSFFPPWQPNDSTLLWLNLTKFEEPHLYCAPWYYWRVGPGTWVQVTNVSHCAHWLLTFIWSTECEEARVVPHVPHHQLISNIPTGKVKVSAWNIKSSPRSSQTDPSGLNISDWGQEWCVSHLSPFQQLLWLHLEVVFLACKKVNNVDYWF